MGFGYELSGAPLLTLVEPNTLTISKVYPMTWFRVKPDLATLARMRWVEGENIMGLARFFKISEGTIRGYLRKIKQDQALVGLGLENEELTVIYSAIRQEEHGQSNRINF